jgi:hypothetical protein
MAEIKPKLSERHDDTIDQPVVDCPACGCPSDAVGCLGFLAHYHCHDCGTWFFERKVEVEDD